MAQQLAVLADQARMLLQRGEPALAIGLCHDVQAACGAHQLDALALLFPAPGAPDDLLVQVLAGADNAAHVCALLQLFAQLAAAQPQGAASLPRYTQIYAPAVQAWLRRTGAQLREASLLAAHPDAAAEALLVQIVEVAASARPLASLAADAAWSASLGQLASYIFETQGLSADTSGVAVEVLQARGCLNTRRRLLEQDLRLQQDVLHAAHAKLVEALQQGDVARAERVHGELRALLDEVPILPASDASLWRAVIAALQGVRRLQPARPEHLRAQGVRRAFGQPGDCYAIDPHAPAATVWLAYAAPFGLALRDISCDHHDFDPDVANARVWLPGATGSLPVDPCDPQRGASWVRFALRGPFAFEVGALWTERVGPQVVEALRQALLPLSKDAGGAGGAGAASARLSAQRANDFLLGLRCSCPRAPSSLLRLVLDPEVKDKLQAPLDLWIEQLA